MSYVLRGDRLRGLGFDKFDLLAQAGVEQCSPLDADCVARNSAVSNIVENLWATQYRADPNTANLPAPKLNFAVDTTRILNNQANDPGGTGFSTVTVNGQTYGDAALRQSADTQLAQQIAGEIRGGAPQNAATDAILKAGNVTVKAPAKAGAAAALPGAGAQGAPQILGLQVEGSPAFELGGVEVPALPWWALALGAAGLAWFAFGKGGR